MNLFIAAIAVIALIAGFLAWCEKYEDGLTGRIALGGIAVACVIIIIGHHRRVVSYEFIPPEITLLLACIAWFLARHAYRFIRYTFSGKYGWTRGGGPPPHQERA